MKDQPYEPITVTEIVDNLAERWGVPYWAEAKIHDRLRELAQDVVRVENANKTVNDLSQKRWEFIAKREKERERTLAALRACARELQATNKQLVVKGFNEGRTVTEALAEAFAVLTGDPDKEQP